MTAFRIPPMQTAIVGMASGSLGVSHEAKVPELEDDMILVRNEAVALNPIDTKLVGKLFTVNAIAGMDFAGTIVALGSKVTTAAADLQVGDRVCGAVMGMHSLTPTVGAFAQYVGASDVVTLKIPPDMPFEAGASMGSAIGTIGLALFKLLALPGSPLHPVQTPMTVLVYGGSTATGTMAIQILKLSGYRPIATCSPRNFNLVRSYGADAVFDYNAPHCVTDIRASTKNGLKYVLDCVSEPETMAFCYQCLGRSGGKYTALEPYPAFLHTRPTVKPDWVLGPTLLGKPVERLYHSIALRMLMYLKAQELNYHRLHEDPP
ncbi:chaperonin 10-like protein [Aspergillus tamarii]|uniref:Chaperonin 10-like protein n=1 Tax=Aspergillus tamarii TaxID=41984 RepID=A0A5N6UX80_ASPTM|nr:chaperonin 10-like protein [Aspergillus tamarii]